MISAELIRRYPFFACLTRDQILTLARMGEELATVQTSVVAFDCDELNEIFQHDREYGYLILQKVAGVLRQRLRYMRIQSLAFSPPIA